MLILTLISAKVCIDVGHGDKSDYDPEFHHTLDGDNLALARAAAKEFELTNFTVLMIRTRNEFKYSRLDHRYSWFKYTNCDYMISVQRNSYWVKELGLGFESYIHESIKPKDYILQKYVHEEFLKVGVGMDRGEKIGNYFVNRMFEGPSVSVFSGFCSTTRDNVIFEQKLEDYGKAIVKGMLRAHAAFTGGDYQG